MYLCEFVQDLIFRCNTCNLNFRAIITYGEFEHYKLEHVDCYYGKSLVHAYLKEKEINGVGLFIDKKLKKYNKFYKTTEYGFDLEFVFLFRTMFRLNEYTDSLFPLSKTHLELTDEFWLLKDEIQLLKKYFLEMNSNKNPKIRAKYLQTYQFYRQEMPLLFEQLERQGFSLSAINSEINWDEIKGYNE